MTRRAVLMKALKSMVSDTRRMLQGQDPSPPDGSSDGDSPALTRILSDLIAYERDGLVQLRAVVAEEQPTLFGFVPTAGRPEREPTSSVGELVERFCQARQETLLFLQELSPGDWQRKAVHASWGPTSLRFLVQHLVEHDTQVLSHLTAARQGSHIPGDVTQQPAPFVRPSTPTQDSEEENDRRRVRKWPRRRRRDH
jgi:hypothetical protein